MLYEENGRITTVFWEWRHKVILLCTVSLGGVLAAAAWLYERDLKGIVATPFFFGTIVFLLCAQLERRIAEILIECYVRGSNLEKRLIESDGWAAARTWNYTAFRYRNRSNALPKGEEMNLSKPPKWSFTKMLRPAYLALAVICGLVAVSVIVVAVAHPGSLNPHSPK